MLSLLGLAIFVKTQFRWYNTVSMSELFSRPKIFVVSLFILLFAGTLGVTLWLGQNYRFPDSTLPSSDTLAPSTVSVTAAPSPVVSKPITILTTGDVMLGRSVNSIGYRRHDFGWSLAEVNSSLAPFDYVIANLETPITNPCPVTDDGMLFCADASSSIALAASNIDLVTLANNHIYNHGTEGYAQTRQLLTAAGEDFVGAGELFTFERANTTFGVIAYDDVSFPIELPEWHSMIASAAAQVDALLVAVHFGVEYRYQPTDRQIELAHAAIDAGARLVIGNHSHWLGTVERYGDGAIIYSHGNFVFDQEWSSETKAGLAAAWTLKDGRVQKVSIYPIHITNYGLSHWAAGTPIGDQILTTFMSESGIGEKVADHVEIVFQAEE